MTAGGFSGRTANPVSLLYAHDRVRGLERRLATQHRREKNLMPALARSEVPEPGVAAEPGSVDLARSARRRLEPAVVDVLGFGEIHVEEVVGRRETRRRPTTDVLVETAIEIRSVLEEVHEVRPVGAEAGDVDPFRRGSELAREADAEVRQRIEGRCGHEQDSTAVSTAVVPAQTATTDADGVSRRLAVLVS